MRMTARAVCWAFWALACVAPWAQAAATRTGGGGYLGFGMVSAGVAMQAGAALNKVQPSPAPVCAKDGIFDKKVMNSCVGDLTKAALVPLLCALNSHDSVCLQRGQNCGDNFQKQLYEGTLGVLPEMGKFLWELPGNGMKTVQSWFAPKPPAPKGKPAPVKPPVSVKKDGLANVAKAGFNAGSVVGDLKNKAMKMAQEIGGAIWTVGTCEKWDKDRCVKPACPNCGSMLNGVCSALGFGAAFIATDIAAGLLTDGATAAAHFAATGLRLQKILRAAQASGKLAGFGARAAKVADWAVATGKGVGAAAKAHAGSVVSAVERVPGARAVGKGALAVAKGTGRVANVAVTPLKVVVKGGAKAFEAYDKHVVRFAVDKIEGAGAKALNKIGLSLARQPASAVKLATETLGHQPREIPGTKGAWGRVADDGSNTFIFSATATPGESHPLNILAAEFKAKGLGELRYSAAAPSVTAKELKAMRFTRSAPKGALRATGEARPALFVGADGRTYITKAGLKEFEAMNPRELQEALKKIKPKPCDQKVLIDLLVPESMRHD